MEITMKESTMVCPAEETPNQRLWLSNLDLVVTVYHMSTVYFYKPNGSSDFFDTKVLKESLSKILVPFYPVAGRLGYDENGRLEIICNAKGVLFIVAETTSIMDDLVQDFTDGSKVPQLLPKIDYSGGISSYPLLGLQQLKLNMPIDGRNRLHPPLPPGYFGNVIFFAALFTRAGDLLSESFIDTVKRIHEILKEMDNEYLRSGIDYIERAPDIEAISRGPQTLR
ncbi:Hydroxycinnamoyl CoA shikimate/quinate hydroxycinnamoyltransferase [Theobroma cacao]|uniref:Hydroxycinnamoyl CoA shikimate/quinate hydroxycinnamoyltransferase n=1 Tax=Theobroma cacao TaxID=3641 RepID=S1RWI1_THECC|nr:Hydroxycinnamoyl CoA shikimate/quinate hydroxycinnamoyltransferase [Theobroma cacao]